MSSIVVFYIGRFPGDDKEEQDDIDCVKTSSNIKTVEVKKPEFVITKVNNYVKFIYDVFS
jgi:hypothetical protein